MRSLFLAVVLTGVSAQAQISRQASEAPLARLELSDGRQILTDVDGFAVYSFDPDKGNVSSCYDSCEQAWPPVLVEPGALVGEALGTTTRKDGSLQLSIDGKPLYFYVGDSAPGDIKGDGLGGVWHLVNF